MAKVISQETFDDVVKENILDFGLNADEAKDETIKQFEAQGISLANIIKDLNINEKTGKPVLNETIDKLKTYLSEQRTEPEELKSYLELLNEECQKSIAHRVLAGKNGAHDAVITLLENELAKLEFNVDLLRIALQIMNNLTNKSPDIFDPEALTVVLKILQHKELKDEQIICLTYQWLQKACIMHEKNRQSIISVGVEKLFGGYLRAQPRNIAILRDLLAVCRFVVLDDDIRAEFGNAHEHARQIAEKYILELTKMLNEIKDPNLLADLLLTIGTLAVRQEFCKDIDEAGGLTYINSIMAQNPSVVRINREALKLLRALAGNDTVKAHIVEQGFPALIKDVLQNHMSNENVVSAALACISTLTLRVKQNSTTFFETGIAENIVEALQQHPKNKIVQRNGAWAVRNMVSRSREQCDTWLSFGVEDLLNSAMKEHPSVTHDIKAALRDLGCKVELKEEWTGKAEKKIMN